MWLGGTCQCTSVALFLALNGDQVHATTLEEQSRMRTWQYEREVAAPALRALGLRGRLLREAWDALVVRGSECGIRSAGDLWGVPGSGLRYSAALVCTERTDAPAETCGRLAVTYSIQEPADTLRPQELYLRWAELHVREAQVNCVFDRPGSRGAEGQSALPWRQIRAALSKELSQREAADKALEHLLVGGFECGVDSAGSSGARLHCTRRPSAAMDCSAERVRVTLAGRKPAGVGPWSARLADLKVQETDMACETLARADVTLGMPSLTAPGTDNRELTQISARRAAAR